MQATKVNCNSSLTLSWGFQFSEVFLDLDIDNTAFRIKYINYEYLVSKIFLLALQGQNACSVRTNIKIACSTAVSLGGEGEEKPSAL